MIANVLSIAGIDPSGGAGLLADLKTFSALGAYGTGVVAALTAQNTRGVTGVQPVPTEFIAQQIDTLCADVRIDAVKIGMLGTAEVIRVVAEALRRHRLQRIVLDPVMIAKSGHALLEPEAVAALTSELLPLADIITPNLPEAAVLLGGVEPRGVEEMRAAARRLRALGPRHVLLKGGHLPGDQSVDVLDDGANVRELPAPRIPTRNTHGTGCTLSAAIAALWPQRGGVEEAVTEAKAWISTAIARSGELSVGSGHGPVHHFHALWPARGRTQAAVQGPR